MKALVPLCLFITSNLLAADDFPEKRLPVDENIWLSNEIVNAQRGRDFVIRRLPGDASPCNNPDKCPPALIIDVANGNTNVKGKLNTTSLYINGVPAINQQGQWVGPTENLRGPQGIQGPKGDTGEGCSILQDSMVCGGTAAPLETFRGPKGDRGTQGVQGPQGIRGPEGVQGPQGETGSTGPQGLQGAKGDKGESCKIEGGAIDCSGFKKPLEDLRGPRGFQGDKGEQGQAGVRGDAGPTGPSGATGPSGLKGDKGDTGATGARGDKGPAGESCIPGASIYPACLDGLKSQKLFVVVSSETIRPGFDCNTESGGYLKKFWGQCPASHPNIIAGSCEHRWSQADLGEVGLVASEPIGSNSWQCEALAKTASVCFEAEVRVWLTCTSLGT